jgi:hypothetical protein
VTRKEKAQGITSMPKKQKKSQHTMKKSISNTASIQMQPSNQKAITRTTSKPI